MAMLRASVFIAQMLRRFAPLPERPKYLLTSNPPGELGDALVIPGPGPPASPAALVRRRFAGLLKESAVSASIGPHRRGEAQQNKQD